MVGTEQTLDEVFPFDFRATAEELRKGSFDLWAPVFDSPLFDLWKEGQPWRLRCAGPPRCGKTTFMAKAGEHLKRHGDNIAVIHLFLGRVDTKSIDSADDIDDFILRVVLRQLLEHASPPRPISSAIADHLGVSTGEGGTPVKLDVASLRELIQGERRRFSATYVLVDELHWIRHLSEEVLVQQLADMGISSVMFVGLPHDSIFSKEGLHCGTCGELQDELPLWAACEECNLVYCRECNEDGKTCHGKLVLATTIEISIDPSPDSVEQYIDHRLEVQYEDERRRQTTASVIRNETENCFGLVLASMNDLEERDALEGVGEESDRLPRYHARFFNLALWQVRHQAEEKDRNLGLLVLALVALVGHETMTFRQLKSALMFLDPHHKRLGSPLTRERVSRVAQGWIRAAPVSDTDDDDGIGFFISRARTYLNERHGFYDQKLDDKQPLLNYGQDMAMLCLKALKDGHETFGSLSGSFQVMARDLRRQDPFLEFALSNWAKHFREYSSRRTRESASDYLFNYYRQSPRLQCLFCVLSDKRQPAASGGLHIAVTFDLETLVKWYIGKRANMNEVDVVTGKTPVMAACEAGHDEILHLLIDAKADASLADKDGRTALWYAIENGHARTVSDLLDLASVSELGSPIATGKTLFMRSIELWQSELKDRFNSREHDRRAIVKTLAESKYSEFPWTNAHGKTVLHIAADLVHEPSLSVILDAEEGKHLTNNREKNEYGRTAMLNVVSQPDAAYSKQRVEALKLLGGHGASASISDAYGRNLLHYAVRLGDNCDEMLIRAIIKLKVDLNGRDSLGWTPLHTAYALDITDAIEVLETAGARKDVEDKKGRNPSEVGREVRQASEDIEKLLARLSGSDVVVTTSHLDSGAPTTSGPSIDATLSGKVGSITHIDPLGQTVLHLAVVLSDSADPIEAILSNGQIDVNARNVFSQTALHVALIRHVPRMPRRERRQLQEIISMLLASEAIDIEALDGNLQSPLDIALRSTHLSPALELLARGAKLTHSPVKINTLFNCAIQSHSRANAETVTRLIEAGADVFRTFDVEKVDEDILGVIEAAQEKVLKQLGSSHR